MAINDSAINNSAINEPDLTQVFISTPALPPPLVVQKLGIEVTAPSLTPAPNLFEAEQNYNSVVSAY